MDPVIYFPYHFPDYGGYFLPWRLWTGYYDDLPLVHLMNWPLAPYIVGVA